MSSIKAKLRCIAVVRSKLRCTVLVRPKLRCRVLVRLTKLCSSIVTCLVNFKILNYVKFHGINMAGRGAGPWAWAGDVR